MENKSMDEWLFEAFAEGEEPPGELKERILSRGQAMRRARRTKRLVAGVAWFLVVASVAGAMWYRKPIAAFVGEIFGSLTGYYGESGTTEQRKEIEEKVYRLGECVKGREYSLTLREMIVDTERVAYTFELSDLDPEDYRRMLRDADVSGILYVNGERSDSPLTATAVSGDGKTITIVGESEFLKSRKLEGEVSIRFKVHSIGWGEDVSAEKWQFETVIRAGEKNQVQQKESGLSLELSDGSVLQVENVVKTAIDYRIHGIHVYKKKLNTGDRVLLLQGEDDMGNPVFFGETRESLRGGKKYDFVMTSTEIPFAGAQKLILTPMLRMDEKGRIRCERAGDDFVLAVGG